MILVTKPYLPPIEKYIKYLEKIWKNQHLTNAGPLVVQLESELKKYLENENCFFVSNGTIALQIAIKALNLSGEIITTPFSYVATTSSIFWESCTPVFADIEPDTLTIDPFEIEKKITDKTSAILATHVYGNPCDIIEIQKIANKYNLKVIYDAAHCFGVKYNNIPVTNYGDISTLSFHATKLFQTVEGGAIIAQDQELAYKISYLRNFGHNGPENFHGLGVNGKNSEFHAAMGLCNLPEISNLINIRKKLSLIYDEQLLKNKKLFRPKIRIGTEYNYAYYPIILDNEEDILRIIGELNKQQIYPRRYFYPSLSKLNYVGKQKMPVAEDISIRVLCLPLFHSLTEQDITKISQIIISAL